MKNNLYKIFKNILPVIRGGVWSLNSIRPGICICKGSRLFKGASVGLHPGCKLNVGRMLTIGNYSHVAVLEKGRLVIGNNVGIGSFNQIICHGSIIIDDNTILGPNVCIYDHNHRYDLEHGVRRLEYDVEDVTIGKNCWIGAGVIILKGVHIGDNCIIGAGSVVTKDIPSGCVAVGSPAKPLNRAK